MSGEVSGGEEVSGIAGLEQTLPSSWYCDERIFKLVEEQRVRAEKILHENRALVETLRDMLLEQKTIDAKTLSEKSPKKK